MNKVKHRKLLLRSKKKIIINKPDTKSGFLKLWIHCIIIAIAMIFENTQTKLYIAILS